MTILNPAFLMARFLAGEAATDPGTIERRLVNSITHGAGLRDATTKQLDFMKKEFVQRYTAELSQRAVNSTPVLPSISMKELAQ